MFSKYLIELFKGSDKFLALKKIGLSINRFAKENELNPAEVKRFDRVLSGDIRHLKDGLVVNINKLDNQKQSFNLFPFCILFF